MYHGLFTLSGTASEASIGAGKTCCKSGTLFGATSKVSTEKGKASHGASTLSDVIGGVSTEKGEAILSLINKAMGGGKGSWKMWTVEPVENL